MPRRKTTGANTEPVVPKKNLFEDDSSDDDAGGAPVANGASGLKVNKEFAQRFEHNKKREEKHRLEEKYGKKQGDDDDSDSSTDESEDDDAFLLTEELDAQMSAALKAIKSKDPRIYSTETTFYAEDDDTQPTKAQPEEAKEKPMYLRDYHREKYMRGDVGADAEEDEEASPKPYAQEQAELKESLLAEIAAAGGDSDAESGEEDFMKRKEGRGVELPKDGVHPARAARVKITDADVKNADKDPELFLSNFMASKAWLPEEGNQWEAFASDDEDGDNETQAEAYENAYNMRFEDPSKSNEVLQSYSRTVTASRSVRREEATGRKKQRELEREKKDAEKRERREERARLRKLKIEEAEEKMKKIKQAAGISGKALKDEDWTKFLDNDFEDDQWETEMRRRFGDEYYAEADHGEGDSEDETGAKKKRKVKKPTWDDDLDIKDLIPDFKDDDDTKPDIELTDDEDDGGAELDDGEDDERPAKKRKTGKDHKKERSEAKRAARIERTKIEALVDARMELDDPTALASTSKAKSQNSGPAFRYRETSPNTFGLTPRDILLAPSDAVLNDFAGLKKLASFRDEEKKRNDRKKLGKKARLRQWRKDNFGAEYEHTGPTYGFEGSKGELAAAADEAAAQTGGDAGTEKKRKRKRKGKSATA